MMIVVVLHLVLGEKTLSDKNIMNVNINEQLMLYRMLSKRWHSHQCSLFTRRSVCCKNVTIWMVGINNNLLDYILKEIICPINRSSNPWS